MGSIIKEDNERKENGIMKKTKISVLFLLTLTAVLLLSACGNNKNNAGSQSSGAQTNQSSSAAPTESTGGAGISESSGSVSGAGNTGNSNGTGNTGNTGSAGTGASDKTDPEESSSGVLEGLMDDVEQGVEDLTGDDASRASDESK